MISPNQNIPKWIVFLIDTALVFFSFFIAYLLRFEFSIPQIEIGPLIFALPIYMMVRILSFVFGNTTEDYSADNTHSITILKVLLIGSLFLACLNPIKYHLWDGAFFLPFSIIILDFLLGYSLLLGFRLLVKRYFKSKQITQ